jgi:hypothetical protein
LKEPQVTEPQSLENLKPRLDDSPFIPIRSQEQTVTAGPGRIITVPPPASVAATSTTPGLLATGGGIINATSSVSAVTNF